MLELLKTLSLLWIALTMMEISSYLEQLVKHFIR